MNNELTDKLYKDYPDLFAQHKLSMYESCMYWGIECGDGWEPILRKLCEEIARPTREVIKRKRFPGYFKFRIKFHNFCRKLERVLKIPTNMLYTAKYDDFKYFPGWKIEFSQIKEKFGTLRVYYDVIPRFEEKDLEGLDKADVTARYHRFVGSIDGAISFATNLSESTCETHGIKGTLNRKGWWKVTCEKCSKTSDENSVS